MNLQYHMQDALNKISKLVTISRFAMPDACHNFLSTPP